MRDVLRTLELEHPAIAGWILDERAAIREHINVFVNERGRRTRRSLATTASTYSPRSAEVRQP